MAATHLGNTADFPQRSLQWLKRADILIFEEDRPARQALKAAQLQRDYLKFNEHQQEETLEALRKGLRQGRSALYMADQGCPNLADPGHRLTAIAFETNSSLLVIPGPSSVTAALAACPFKISSYHFAGFLPQKEESRKRRLRDLAHHEVLVLLDTPYRLKHLIASCSEVLGKERNALLALEISGETETYHYASLGQLRQHAEFLPKANFVLVIKA